MAPTPKRILITGATSGIGRDAALHLARMGHRVFATGRRQERLDALGSESDRIVPVPMDLADGGSIASAKELIDRLTDGHGVDVVVNNAGYGLNGPLALVPVEEVRRQFETNVFGLLRVTQVFTEAMRARGEGRVINIGSVLGTLTIPFTGAYCMSKHAVEALSDALRLELRPLGIHVSLIQPGGIRTEFDDRALESIAPYTEPGGLYTESALAFKAMRQRIAPGKAPTSKVVRLVDRAVHARRPRARYRTPWRDWLGARLMHILPTRIGDAVMSRVSGLKR